MSASNASYLQHTQPTTHVCLRLRLCLFVSILFAYVLRVREWLGGDGYACGCGSRMAMVVCTCVGGCGWVRASASVRARVHVGVGVGGHRALRFQN
jgi:hypothetical protein